MGRFFKTSTTDYRDFMYRPNLELMKQVAEKAGENQYIKSKLINQVDDVDFNHIEYDNDFAKKEREAIQQEVDDLTEIMNNSDNPNDYLPKLRELKRKINESFDSGNISKMQSTYKAKKELDEKLAKLTNPADREAYEKGFWNDWTKKIEEARKKGEYGDVFKPGEIYESINDMDFLKSDAFKQLQAEEGGEIKTTPQGKWLVKQGDKWKELSQERIAKAYQEWYTSNPNALGRARNARYFNEDEGKYFDATGNLRFDKGSYLGDRMSKIAETYAYRNNFHTQDLQANQYAVMATQHAYAMKRQAAAQRAKAIENLPKGSVKITDKKFYESQQMQYAQELALEDLRAKTGIKNATSFKDALEKLESVKGTLGEEKYEVAKKYIQATQLKFDGYMEASYAPLLTIMSPEQVNAYKKELNATVEAYGANKRGYISTPNVDPEISQVISNTNMQEMSINELNTLLGDEYSVSLVKGEVKPVIASIRDDRGNSVFTSIAIKNLETGKVQNANIMFKLSEIAGDESMLLLENKAKYHIQPKSSN